MHMIIETSLVRRLRQRLAIVVDEFSKLVGELSVYRKEKLPGVIHFAPEYSWTDISPSQRAVQLKVKRDYEPISELLRLVLRQAPEALTHQLDEVDKEFRIWLELSVNWSVKPDPKQNMDSFKSVLQEFEEIFSVLEKTGENAAILVPDTNSLLLNPDPVAYQAIANSATYIFMLLPTVLGELDRLQLEHKNPELRERAKKAITRIKGWRKQGSLQNGVKVDGTITVCARHNEPDMERTLSWLDGDISDDRILAAVLELFSEHPSARIVLVTGDVNLQNKADAALIETAENPC